MNKKVSIQRANIFVINALRWYQRTVSWDHTWKGVFGGNRICRFYPSCSQYAIDSFGQHGFGPALTLTLKRLVRCNPLNGGGVDEVN